jgi:hypothetical protein
MKRHVLAGRFGLTDSVRIPAGRDEQLTLFQLVPDDTSLGYGIGDTLDLLGQHGVFPSELGVDLLIVAAHVHAADTRISRTEESQDSWTREIRLVVPVSDPARWRSAAATLESTLNFLTGDRWTVGFRARPRRFANIVDAPESTVSPVFDTLSLFSGGLDSLIGAIDLLQAGRTPLLISHAGDAATAHAQTELLDSLQSAYPDCTFERVPLWMVFETGLVTDVSREDSTRGRSFLFFAFGVLAGTGLAHDFVLRAPENGLIALNVPLDTLRLGSNSTRTTHPHYIANWNRLLSELGIGGRIENPYWAMTKGEMTSACTNQQLLRSLVAESLSCSSPQKGRFQGLPTQNCGYCLPCLIRRAALRAGFGAGRDPTTYTMSNLRARALDSTKPEGRQVRSFQVAIERLRQSPQLANILIHKSGPLSDNPANLPHLAGVYQRGLAEVGQLLSGVVTRPG